VDGGGVGVFLGVWDGMADVREWCEGLAVENGIR
jgi:hypothetical protein